MRYVRQRGALSIGALYNFLIVVFPSLVRSCGSLSRVEPFLTSFRVACIEIQAEKATLRNVNSTFVILKVPASEPASNWRSVPFSGLLSVAVVSMRAKDIFSICIKQRRG